MVACDCGQYREGIVIDSESKLGIENVEIFKNTRPEQVFYSNASGYYEWRGISGGLSPKCPEPKLYFIHPEYDTVFSSGNTSVVKMKRKK
jgi:hypothetical protein